MQRRIALLISVLIMATSANHVLQAAPANAIVPGALRADATYEHIGVRWSISGDDDHDSSLTLEFRRSGESVWRPGAPAMRAYPTIIVDGQPLGLNYWAASALFLQPGQTYELRLTLHDPDGGDQVQTISVATRRELQPNPAGQQRYVVPGSGGGDGTPGNPFKGLQAAANAAQPGDVFHVAAGTYSPFQLLASGTADNPIVFQDTTTGSAVVDGNGTDRGVITLGEYNQSIGYVIVEGLIVQNGAWGIDAQRSHDIVIRRNTLQNVDDGILNRRDGGTEYNQTIADNVIIGRLAWPGTGIPSEEGIDLRGTGNVVAHNTLRYFSDCISVVPQTGPSYSNDVFGNDVAYCVDDGLEIDYNQSNTRVWRNRVMNSRMGVSVQPIQGGPAYIFRNEFFNLESNPIKMHNDTTGYFVVHNTGAKLGNGQGDDGAQWRNVVFRNNLFLGTRYAFEFTTAPDEGFRDFDYNAWGTTHAAGSPSDPDFKWNNVRYSRLPNLQAIGVETHGITATFGHLNNATLPATWNVDV
ncbi:MAG: right-handed parallel beta-helix repeat-containing protein, partial [Chloroflexi bacterium]|nr:right-handed parallel beta-helix repeat-containing protein [Chloroflexota bacterium]